MLSVELIPFKNFKEKIKLTKKYGGKAKIEIIDNKYVILIRGGIINERQTK